jgi:hypothetical protein
MSLLKNLSLAAVLVVPLMAATAPAQALTSHQYQAQGRGMYVSSKARGYGWHRHWGWNRGWHRGWHRRWRGY